MKKLKIFLVMGGSGTSLTRSKIWLRNFHDSLVSMGHHVDLFDPDEFLEGRGLRRFTPEAKEALSHELPKAFLQKASTIQYDYFLSYLHADWIHPETMDDIAKRVFTINYTTNFHQFPLYREIGRRVGLNIYVTKAARESFESLGVPSYWMPFAANPDFYKPARHRNSEVAFVGLSHGTRAYTLWRVLQNGVNLQIYGPGWQSSGGVRSIVRKYLDLGRASVATPDERMRMLNERLRVEIIRKINGEYPGHVHTSLSDDEYAKTVAEAGIVINYAESRFDGDFLDHRMLLGCNLRDFEVTMSGSLLCTQHSDELPFFFHEEKEVVTFQNEYELAEKLKYYSAHENKRDRIAAAGRRRAMKDHTWEKRFEELFRYVKTL